MLRKPDTIRSVRICPRCSEGFPDTAGFCPFDGEALKEREDAWIGRIVAGRFRLMKRLGDGGMSSVYLAKHVLIERFCAIKILRADAALNPQLRERFLREARAVNRIDHPSIVGIMDFGETDGVAYLVMEFVDGPSVLEALRNGPFAWRRAATLARELAGALGRAHQVGIIHRDVKPENVLLAQRADGERAMLTDFGIAKMIDAPALTFSEQVIGTPGYIAPEYLSGAIPDARFDMYAMGVLLYEMLSAELPYNAHGQSELLFKPLTHAPIPLDSRITGLPSALVRLVHDLMEKDPAMRVSDAFVLEERLHGILTSYDGPALEASPPSAAPDSLTHIERGPLKTEVDPVSRVHPGSLVPSLPREELKTLVLPARNWKRLTDVEAAIEVAMHRSTNDAWVASRARVFAEEARGLLAQLDRSGQRVLDAQRNADALHAQGRDARQQFGRAMDELARDRARSKGTRVAEDLTFQIGILEGKLDEFNEAHEQKLAIANGELEGVISGYRRLQAEVARAIGDAEKALTTRTTARPPKPAS